MRTIEDINNLIDYVRDNPINFTWVTPKSIVKESGIPDAGNGRFATEPIKKGETVAILGGLILTEDEYQQIRKRFSFVSGLLVHEDFKIHQVNFISDNNGTLNHCCDPNIAIRGQIMVRAIRDIEVGEEFFLDYGTVTNQDLVLFEDCQCGASNCRRYITAKDWLSLPFSIFHWDNFSYHLLEVIKNTKEGEIITQLMSLEKIDISKSPILSEEMKRS